MYRLNPGRFLSTMGTSARESSAMESMYCARSRKPFISPSVWETGLNGISLISRNNMVHLLTHRPICKVNSIGNSSFIFLNSSCARHQSLDTYTEPYDTYNKLVTDGDPLL